MTNTAKTSTRALLFVCGILLVLSPAMGQAKIPPLAGRIVDSAGMVSSGTEREIASILEDLEQSDSTQIVVLTVNSLGDEAIEEYGIRVAETWQIGQAGSDNGALLIVSKEDRKLRIEVGYGLEGSLTDLIAGRIINNVITPAFKSGDFDQGFLNGVKAMVQVVKGEYEGSLVGEVEDEELSLGDIIFLTLLALFVLWAMGRKGRRGGSSSHWYSGSSSSHSSSSSSSSFSGGGGSFGGGGASGSW